MGKVRARGTKNIESIYPLSPLQQGLVFHSMLSPGSGVYAQQTHRTIRGNLDAAALRQAWQTLVERHPVLRTFFVLDQDPEPLQVVVREIGLPWHEEDWRGFPEPEQRSRLEAYLQQDRARGFDLAKEPPCRAALFHLEDDTWEFVWNNHHAAVDGWSTAILRHEALRLYQALHENRLPELAPVAPYQKFIEWLQAQDPGPAEAYWQRTLDGFGTPTPLPLDRAPGERTEGGDSVVHRRFELSDTTTEKLRSLTKSRHLTLNTLLNGAWALLLNRYTGEKEVVYGATQSGRPPTLPGVERMVGLFINSIPVRVRISHELSTAEWLSELQLQLAELRQYDFSSLVEIKRWCGLRGDFPLFETLLVYENYPRLAEPILDAGPTFETPTHIDSSTYPLTVVVEEGDGLCVRFVSDPRRLSGPAVEQIAGHLVHLLDAIADHTDRPLGRIPVLGEAERQRLLVDWNRTRTSYPRSRRIQDLFEEQVERAPDSIALVFGEQSWTYAELNRRANRLAHHLQRDTLIPETPIALCLERGPDAVVGVLGILKAGGTYVPLDPDYPAARLSFMLSDTRAPILITRGRLRSLYPDYSGRTICVDTDAAAIAQEHEDNPTSGTTPESLAYVIYTSGSTGNPKGSCIPHRAVVRLVRETNYVELGPDEVLLQFAPISFDASTFELWGSLLNGAKLVVFPPETPSLEELGRSIEEYGITTLWLTATLFQQMVDNQLERLSGVRQLLAGGEALSPLHARKMIETLSQDRKLINGYGPTENTTFTCCHVMTASSTIGSSVPIGRPIAHTQVYLLDENLEPVPIGASGELCTGGDGLARDYLHDPELTARKFVPNPFSDDPGARLYRTGDLARHLPDGTIEFLGRIDDQVKIRGYRVEPGEIEASLLEMAGVREAVVVGREIEPGDRRLVAYVVPEEGCEPDFDELRRGLRRGLPGFMVPSAFVALKAVPLTSSGKVDRRRLPAPEQPRSGQPAAVPRNTIEARIAEIWTGLLRVDRVGIHDDFFDLGGHSLTAMRVISRVSESFGVEIPLKALFDNPTVVGLTEAVNSLRWAQRGLSAPTQPEAEEIEL